MSVILVGGKKGGSGKTMIATMLAAWFSLQFRIQMVDLDEENFGATAWFQQRKKLKPTPTNPQGFHTNFELSSYPTINKGIDASIYFDHIVVDAPPMSPTAKIVQLVERSDIVIIPVRAARNDVQSNVGFVNSLMDEGIPLSRFKFVISSFLSQPSRISIQDQLSHAGYSVYRNALPMKQAYTQCMNYGVAINEVRYSTLRQSAIDLLNEMEPDL